MERTALMTGASSGFAMLTQAVADLIARIVETPRPLLRYVVGRDARPGLMLRRALPWSVFERILIKESGIDH